MAKILKLQRLDAEAGAVYGPDAISITSCESQSCNGDVTAFPS